MSLKEPNEGDFVGKEQRMEEYMSEIIQKAEDSLYSDNWLSVDQLYTEWLDVDSFVDWYLVNEFSKNNDACWFSSVYLYYNPADKKIHMGPDWDFDISCEILTTMVVTILKGFGLRVVVGM